MAFRIRQHFLAFICTLALALGMVPAFAYAAAQPQPVKDAEHALAAEDAEVEVTVFSVGDSSSEDPDHTDSSAPPAKKPPVAAKDGSSADNPQSAARTPLSRIAKTFDEYGGISAVLALVAAAALVGIGYSLHRTRPN